ncbi:Rab GDP dissociation inhibitor [Pancytospora epiphaga]|nr:Rab GDP dissociation inhibitor [Pancytospora epiphaga]
MNKNMKESIREQYDYVIIGTGLSETAISCILAQSRKYKILHIDTSPTYGSDFATLQYNQVLSHFGAQENAADGPLVGQEKEFNVDLTPKLMFQDSQLKEFLLEHEIHNLVSFTSIKGSFLYTDELHSIPTTEVQSLRSSVVSLLQKPRVIRFFWNVRAFFKDKSVTVKETMRQEFEKFGLNSKSIDFIGHAIALNLNDDYLDENPVKTYEKIVKYVSSIVCYEDTESPYIYPLYGLSELCQAFARRSALFGTLFMLNARIEVIEAGKVILTDPDGICREIEAGRIICDPRYSSTSRVEKQIIRCIMILKKGQLGSRNVIFLKSQLRRKNDIFCVVLGPDEMASPAGYEVGILSTVRETNADPEVEISGVLKKFEAIRVFTEVRDLMVNDSTDEIIFTRGVDESAVMDNIYDDIMDVIKQLSIDL